MRKNKRINFTMVLVLLAMVALLMLPTQALSAKKEKDVGVTNPETPVPVVPPDGVCDYTEPNFAADGDNDGDGFTNQQECEGIQAGENMPYNAYLTYPPCDESTTPADRKNCLDPESPDLFVILIPLEGGKSLIPEDPPDPLQYIYGEKFDQSGALTGHLGVQTHLVNDAILKYPAIGLPDRWVIVGQQKALRVAESEERKGIFGISYDTTIPINDNDATVYTYEIRDYVNKQFSDFADGGDHPQIWGPFIWHTIAHETGHGIKLYYKLDKQLKEYHLKPESGKIMEQSIKVQGIEFFISDQFSDESILNFQIAAPL